MTIRPAAMPQGGLGAQGQHPRQARLRAQNEQWADAAGSRLLIVDGSCERRALEPAFAALGVHAEYAGSTLSALIAFGRLAPAAVVVAVDAAGVPATEFIAALRADADCPIIAVLRPESTSEEGPLLMAGADAVVYRPYSAAQLWAILSGLHAPFDESPRVSFGPLDLDVAAFTVRVDGRRIPDLPLREFEVLRVLMTHAPHVVHDTDMRAAIWGGVASGPRDNTIAVHMGRLRGRLEGVAQIRRIRALGYALTLD